MTLFPLDSVRNAPIDRRIEPVLEAVRDELLDFPFDAARDAGTAEEVVEAYDMARPRLNLLAGLASGRGLRILDVSTGIGFLPVILRHLSLQVIATELEPSLARFARSHGVQILPYDVGRSSPPVSQAPFDTLIFAEVLEHLKQPPVAVLTELTSLLRPGGTLLLTTPNIARLAHLEALAAGENFLEPFSEDIPEGGDPTDYVEHVREYSIREVVDAVENAGLAVEEVLMTGWGEAGYAPLPNPYANEIIVLSATR
jgi:2-polyprenyl-3-methyl-5-hydroxy-6-metoxy-1,4-benzoquinol methylase